MYTRDDLDNAEKYLRATLIGFQKPIFLPINEKFRISIRENETIISNGKNNVYIMGESITDDLYEVDDNESDKFIDFVTVALINKADWIQVSEKFTLPRISEINGNLEAMIINLSKVVRSIIDYAFFGTAPYLSFSETVIDYQKNYMKVAVENKYTVFVEKFERLIVLKYSDGKKIEVADDSERFLILADAYVLLRDDYDDIRKELRNLALRKIKSYDAKHNATVLANDYFDTNYFDSPEEDYSWMYEDEDIF